MSLTVSNVFNQTQELKMVTNQKANQKEIWPLIVGGIILFGLAVGATSCNKEQMPTQNINTTNNSQDINDLLTLITNSLPACPDNEATYKQKLNIIDTYANRFVYASCIEFFEMNPNKLSEFAVWHSQTGDPYKDPLVLKAEDYTAKRASIVILGDSAAKDWYNSHCLNLVG